MITRPIPHRLVQWLCERRLHPRHRELLRRDRCGRRALGRGTGLQCRPLADRHPPAIRRRSPGTRLARTPSRHRARGARGARRRRPDLREHRCHRRHQRSRLRRRAAGRPELCEGALVRAQQATDRCQSSRGPHPRRAARGAAERQSRHWSFPSSRWSSPAATLICYLAERKDDAWTYPTSATPATTRPVKPSTKSRSCWPGLSRRPGHRLPRQPRRSAGREIPLRSNKAPRSPQPGKPSCRKTSALLRLLLQRHQDSRLALRRDSRHAGTVEERRDKLSRNANSHTRGRTWPLRPSDARSCGILSACGRQRPGREDLARSRAAFDVATLLVTGGVAANCELRATFQTRRRPGHPSTSLRASSRPITPP